MPITTARRIRTESDQLTPPQTVLLRTRSTEVGGLNIPFPGNTDSGDCIGATTVGRGIWAWIVDAEGKGSRAAAAANALYRVVEKCGSRWITDPRVALYALHESCRAFDTRAAATILSITHDNIATIGVAGVQAPSILDDETGKVSVVEASGALLGIPITPTFTLSRVQLSPKALLVTGSDGLFEAENARGEFINTADFGRALRGHSDLSITSNLVRLLGTIREHSPQQQDDLSMLMLRCSDSTSSLSAALRRVPPQNSGREHAEPPNHRGGISDDDRAQFSPSQLRDLAYASE